MQVEGSSVLYLCTQSGTAASESPRCPPDIAPLLRTRPGDDVEPEVEGFAFIKPDLPAAAGRLRSLGFIGSNLLVRACIIYIFK